MSRLMQGSTNLLRATVKGYDLTGAESARLSIATRGGVQNFDLDRMTIGLSEGNSLVLVHLTQEETLAMKPTAAQVQLKWRNPDGEAYVTRKTEISVGEAIDTEVI